jgi:hypothetical protein
LEVAPDRRYKTSLVVACHQLQAVKSTRLKISEELVVRPFDLGVGHVDGEELAASVLADALDDQDTLTGHLTVDADVLVACVDHQVHVRDVVQSPVAPGGEVPVRLARQPADG